MLRPANVRPRRGSRTTAAPAAQILEERILLSGTTLSDPPESAEGGLTGDESTPHVSGCCCPGCALPAQEALAAAAAESLTSGDSIPLADTFRLHSLPGATKVIYLDFDGHTTSGTNWNSIYTGGAAFTTGAFSFEGDASFSDAELARIHRIWQRVAEDYAPFGIDVTTQDPGPEALRKSGTGDTAWGVRVVVGGSGSDWYGSSAGGVAYVGSFSWGSDTPCYVFENNLGNGNEKYTAEAISHEAGHTLGLSHDGTASAGYYQGHGSGETGWAPVMGNGYYKQLTQWSKGQYPGATQTQDDLAVITSTTNGVTYRADDHGDTTASATFVSWAGTGLSASGLIGRNTDYDVFAFDISTAGTLILDVSPSAVGANLDVLAELYDAAGILVARGNPLASLGAYFDLFVSAGRYYLRVDGTGKAASGSDPGYSDYGSLGRYAVAATFTPPAPVSVTVSPAVDEDGTRGLTYTFTRAGSTASALTVAYQIGGTATFGTDYGQTGAATFSARSGTVTFAAGQSTAWVTIDPTADDIMEGDETVMLTLLAGPTYVVSSPETVVGTIGNDDISRVSVFDVSITEGHSGTRSAFVSVKLSSPSDVPVTVHWTTADATARAGGDYVAASGTITFAAGETEKTLSLPVTGDVQSEGREAFYVRLSSPTAGAELLDGTAVVTISDDDPRPALSVSDATVVEGDPLPDPNPSRLKAKTLSFKVTASRPSANAYAVRFRVEGGTATPGVDYLGPVISKGAAPVYQGTLTFAPGQTSKTLTFTVLGDLASEPDETLRLVIEGPSDPSVAFVFDGEGTGTILNDDVTVSVSSPPVVAEGAFGCFGAAVFEVRLSQKAAHDVAVAYRTAALTATESAARGFSAATAGADYLEAAGILVIKAGDDVGYVRVPLLGDGRDEPNFEAFKLLLSAPTNAKLDPAVSSAVAAVADDDATPVVSVRDVSVVEGPAGTKLVTVTAELSSESGRTVSVDYATVAGTASAGTDYVHQTGTFKFAPGATTAKATFTILGDAAYEPDEFFSISLSLPVVAGDAHAGAVIGTETANVTILDDDAASPARLSVSDVRATEGDPLPDPNPEKRRAKTLSFKVTATRAPAAGETFSVRYRILGGTAVEGADYFLSGGSAAYEGVLEFLAGQTSKTVTVTLVGDTFAEGDETLRLELFDVIGAEVLDGVGVGTIADDDASLAVAAPPAVADGAFGEFRVARFAVILSKPADRDVSVAYRTASLTAAEFSAAGVPGLSSATAGKDYLAVAGILVIKAGDTVGYVEVPLLGDDLDEADEAFRLVLTAPAGVTLADASAVAVIADDDPTPVLSVRSVRVLEGSPGEARTVLVTFTLSAASGRTVTADWATADEAATCGTADGGDYCGASGQVVISAGQTSKTATLTVYGDGAAENDEAFLVRLLSAEGAASGAEGAVTLVDALFTETADAPIFV